MMAAAHDDPLHHHALPPLNRAAACDRHPDQRVTGFCASCLRERLAGLDPASRRPKPSSSSSGAPAALKSLFFRLPGTHLSSHNAVAAAPSSSSFLPELRRCKSFSGGGGAPRAAALEPQRRSCDVRAPRGTLWSLFHLDDGGGNPSHLFPPPVYFTASASAGEGEAEIASRGLGFAAPVLESREEEEEDDDDDDEEHYSDAEPGEPERERVGEGEDEMRAAHLVLARESDGEEDLRTMKEHIDLDAQSKKPPPKDIKEIAGSFWLAASVFSKRLQMWRRKHKAKKHGAGEASAGSSAAPTTIRAEELPRRSRRCFRETQSEVAVDALGRRSCDTDPRISLDAGRISFDDPRYSWDEPRASWDGCLLGGGRSVFPRLPPMLSVIEDAPVTAALPVVHRSDGQIPVEGDFSTPGGSAQTREYYADSSSQRRRRSLDRSSSVRQSSMETADEPPPPKPASSNARVSPTSMANEYLHHVSRFERDYGDSKSSSLRDDCSESFDSTYRDPLKGGGGAPKKPRRWSRAWSLWGLIHGRGHSKGVVGPNVVERSLSESWPELRRGHSGKFFRSNSSVSSRNSFSCGNGGTGLGSMRRTGLEVNGYSGKKRREEFGLERNRSARYSPSHVDNGLLRFYLTPMTNGRWSKGQGKGWHKNTHSFTRSMLGLY